MKFGCGYMNYESYDVLNFYNQKLQSTGSYRGSDLNSSMEAMEAGKIMKKNDRRGQQSKKHQKMIFLLR